MDVIFEENMMGVCPAEIFVVKEKSLSAKASRLKPANFF
jgi:hypothetical protein